MDGAISSRVGEEAGVAQGGRPGRIGQREFCFQAALRHEHRGVVHALEHLVERFDFRAGYRKNGGQPLGRQGMVVNAGQNLHRAGISLGGDVKMQHVTARAFLAVGIIEVGVGQGAAHDARRVVDRMGGREAQRRQAVVFKHGMSIHQQHGKISGLAARGHFVNLYLLGAVDDVVMGLYAGVFIHEFVIAVEAAGMEKRVACCRAHDKLDEHAAGGIAGGQLVPGAVGQLQLEICGIALRPQPIQLGMERLVLQHIKSGGDGAVEVLGQGAQAELFAVLLHQLQHEGIGPRHGMHAIRRARFQKKVIGGNDYRLFQAGHVASLAGDLLFFISRVEPLVVGSLFHESGTGKLPVGANGFGDERMAGSAQAGVGDVFAENGGHAYKLGHRRFKGQEVGPIDHAVGIEIDVPGMKLAELLFADFMAS